MDKILITELNKISQLMGVISEAIIGSGPFIDIIKDITKLAEKNVGKISRTFDDAVKDLKYVKTDEDAIKLLAKFTNESPEIAEKIIPRVMQTIDADEKLVLKQLEDLVTADVKKGGMTQSEADKFIDGWVDENLKTEFTGVKEIIKKDLKTNVRNSIKPKPNKPVTKKQENLVTQIKNVGSTWYTTLQNAGLSKWEIASVSKAAPFRKLRADVQLFAENIINNRIVGTKNVIEEMFGKLKTFTEKLEEGVVDYNYIRDINITLQSFKNSEKLDIDILRKELVKSLKTAKGPKGETIPYDIINKIDMYLSENIPTDIKSPSWISEWLPETTLGSFYKDLTKAEIDFQSRFWTLMERNISYLTTGTLKRAEEFRSYWIKRGIPKGLLKMYVDVSLVTKIYVPFIFGTLASLVQAFGANLPGGEKMGYAERVGKLLSEKMWNAILPKDDDGTVNWLKTLNPFNFFWDNIYNGIDKISKGEFSWIGDLVTGQTKKIENEAEKKKQEYEKNNKENNVEPSPEPSPKPSPSSDDDIRENTMKNNLKQRIHSVLKERLNEQKALNNPFKEKLDVLKTKTQNLLSGLPSWTKNYPCLSDRGQIVKTTSDDVVAFIGKESKQYFYKNMNYLYKGKKDRKGKWSCNNGKLYIEDNDADGKTWTKDTGWVEKTKTEKDEPKKDEPKKDNTSNKKTKQSKYTKCSEELPIKQWCKNETIRKVQACLKMPKRYQTGNFGPITQEYLESRDQNGTSITTETILNICGTKNPLSSVSGSTGGNAAGGDASGTAIPYSSGLNAGTPNAGGQKPQSKTGYEDYTVDEIEYSNDTQKTKSSTPSSSEKPEGEGTGYEGYSEEKPNQPVSPSTPPATGKAVNLDTSSKKSFYNPQNPDNI